MIEPPPVPPPCPTVVLPEKPPLPKISLDMDPRQQVSLLRQALAIAEGYAKELEIKLAPYAAPAPPSK